MPATPRRKQRGDIFVGFLASESNPPILQEFLDALGYIATCVLDKVLFAVVDIPGQRDYSQTTREDRLAMARLAATAFRPFIEVFDPCQGRAMSREEAAFRLFGLNPEKPLSLFYLSAAVGLRQRTDVVDRLVTDIRMRLHGFDPRKHRVVAVFQERSAGERVVLDEAATHLADANLFGVMYVDIQRVELPEGWREDEMLLRAITSEGEVACALLTTGVAGYISQHRDYRGRLTSYLSQKLTPP